MMENEEPMGQKEAVFKAVSEVLKLEEPKTVDKWLISKEVKTQVKNKIVFGLFHKRIKWGKDWKTMAEVTKYASGLISNWLKKDKRYI